LVTGNPAGEITASRSERLPRAVYWFGGTSFANDLASEMIYPLLPAFVTRTLGGGALVLGVLDGVAETIAAAFKLVSGHLADRRRLRAPLIVVGYGVAALVRPLIALAGAAWQVVVLRAVDRLGKGVRTAPRDASIADVTAAEVRGRAFGLHRGADHAGAVVGPLAAAALIAAGLGVREVFWIAAAPGALAVLLAWNAVREAAHTDESALARAPSGGPVGDGDPPHEPIAPGVENVRPFGALVAVLSMAALLRVPETILILRAQELGVAVAAVPMLWAALHVVRTVTSFPGGSLADRWGPRRTLALGWLCYAVFVWDFAVAENRAQAWIIFLALGLVAGLTESPERKLVAELAPVGRRGRGFGWYHGTLAAAALPGAALLGWLYQTRGAHAALVLSAATTLLAAALLPLSRAASRR
jgi:MFS family permease